MFVPSFKFGRASLSNKFCVNLPSKIVSVLAALSGRRSPWRRRGTQNKQINYITKRVLSHNYKKNAYTAHNTHNTLHTPAQVSPSPTRPVITHNNIKLVETQNQIDNIIPEVEKHIAWYRLTTTSDSNTTPTISQAMLAQIKYRICNSRIRGTKDQSNG